MASRDETLDHVDAVLKAGPDHPFFDRALQYVTDHGYGKAMQPVQHDVGDSLAALLTKMASG